MATDSERCEAAFVVERIIQSAKDLGLRGHRWVDCLPLHGCREAQDGVLVFVRARAIFSMEMDL